MEKIKFETTINTPAAKVYNCMLADGTYRQWTAEFNPSSFYEGKWETGEKMLFVGISSEGKKEGMVSRIAIAEPGKQVSIEHLGILKNDTEDLDAINSINDSDILESINLTVLVL